MKRLSVSMLLLVVLGTLLTACGSAKSSAASKTTSTTNSFTAAYEAYRTCMSQNGVNLPAQTGNGRFNGGNPEGGTRPEGGTGTPPAGGYNGDGTGTRPTTTLPAGVTQAQYDKAQTACASKLPARGNRAGGTANATQFTAYLGCLSDHGVTVDKTGGAQALANIDRTTATFQAAQTACAPLLPQRSTSTTTTSI